MSIHADKTEQNKTQTLDNLPVQKQNSNSAAFKFVDNRPAAIAQRKLQKAISDSPRVQHLKAYHEMANNYIANKIAQRKEKSSIPIQRTIKGEDNTEAIIISDPKDDEKREEKGEIPDAVPHEKEAIGHRKIMIIPTDRVADLSSDPPLVDAFEWSKEDLMAWKDACDRFDKSNPWSINRQLLIDRRNKLSTQYIAVQRLLESPVLLKKRNDKEIADAKTLTETKLLELQENNWLQLSNEKYLEFINHVKSIIDDPTVMNQGGYPLCGPDVVLRSIAIYKPMVYARYMISLVEGKQAKIGNKTFNITEPVKAKRYKEKTKAKIPDLLGMSALRSASNSRAYNKIRSDGNKNFAAKWHAGISGSTTLSQAVTWAKEMGIKDPDIKQGSYLFFSNSNSSVLTTVNGYLQDGHAVMLMINPAIIGNSQNTSVSKSILYRHWVNLISDFEKKETDWTANVLTWGKLKTMTFQEAQISRSILGFLAVDFKNMPDATLSGMSDID
jgi:hypothetical protein